MGNLPSLSTIFAVPTYDRDAFAPLKTHGRIQPGILERIGQYKGAIWQSQINSSRVTVIPGRVNLFQIANKSTFFSNPNGSTSQYGTHGSRKGLNSAHNHTIYKVYHLPSFP